MDANQIMLITLYVSVRRCGILIVFILQTDAVCIVMSPGQKSTWTEQMNIYKRISLPAYQLAR